jgi:GT2 family glycosyltransferase
LTHTGFVDGAHVRVSVVVPAFGEEPLLQECVGSALIERDVEVILVDNGCESDAVDRLEGRDRLRIVKPGRNTGFAEGCNLGVSKSLGEFIVLLNSDAIARPGAIAALVSALDDPSVGISTASVRLLSDPARLNSSGNPVHYVGLTWSGNLGEVAASTSVTTEVAGASGAAMAVRKRDWDELEGFFAPMFAYYEDVEFSLRTWLAGRRVVYVPEAEVWHDYSFSRNRRKYFLLERNRLLMVLTVYQARTLATLALPLLGFEVAMLAMALRAGWLRQKLTSYWWLVTHISVVRERRRVVQGARKLDDTALFRLLTAELDPGHASGVDVPPWAVGVSRVSWRIARWMLPNRQRRRCQRFEADKQNSL